jgi:hypothetical protein
VSSVSGAPPVTVRASTRVVDSGEALGAVFVWHGTRRRSAVTTARAC